MKYNRTRKGHFKSKRQIEKDINRQITALALVLLSSFCLILVAVADTTTSDPAPTFEEQLIQDIREENKRTTPPTENEMHRKELCDLIAVVCPEEEPVIDAVRAISDALGKEVTKETHKRVAYLYAQSVAHDVPFNDAVKTVYCESMWYSQQSSVWSEHGQEPSFGLAQIHIPSHPHITKDMAMDAYFAIDFLVEHWHTPQAKADSMWYGYSRQTGACTNGLTINL